MDEFDGETDRFLRTEDGGLIRFVAPKNGFNSHEYNNRRPKQLWAKAACFSPKEGFIVSVYNFIIQSLLSFFCVCFHIYCPTPSYAQLISCTPRIIRKKSQAVRRNVLHQKQASLLHRVVSIYMASGEVVKSLTLSVTID